MSVHFFIQEESTSNDGSTLLSLFLMGLCFQRLNRLTLAPARTRVAFGLSLEKPLGLMFVSSHRSGRKREGVGRSTCARCGSRLRARLGPRGTHRTSRPRRASPLRIGSRTAAAVSRAQRLDRALFSVPHEQVAAFAGRRAEYMFQRCICSGLVQS